MVKIYWDTAIDLYRVSTPSYSESFRQDMISLPWQDRGWDAQKRSWCFAEEHLTLVVDWCRAIWPGSEPSIKDKDQVARESRMVLPSGEFSFFQKASVAFVEGLDAEALAAAFKNQAQRSHPDKGGDGHKFSDFNSAYQELKKTLNDRSKH